MVSLILSHLSKYISEDINALWILHAIFFLASELLPPGKHDMLHAQGAGWRHQAAGDGGGEV